MSWSGGSKASEFRAREWCARGKWGNRIAGKGIWCYAILAEVGDCGLWVGTGGCGQAAVARRGRRSGGRTRMASGITAWIPVPYIPLPAIRLPVFGRHAMWGKGMVHAGYGASEFRAREFVA